MVNKYFLKSFYFLIFKFTFNFRYFAGFCCWWSSRDFVLFSYLLPNFTAKKIPTKKTDGTKVRCKNNQYN